VIDSEKGRSPATDKPNDLLSAEGVTTTTLNYQESQISMVKSRCYFRRRNDIKNTRIKVTGVKGNSIVVKPVKPVKPVKTIRNRRKELKMS
jgi:hypothetical protein